jgi:preprotein translocase subunit SecB
MRALLQLDDYWVDDISIQDGISAPSGPPGSAPLPDIDFDVFKAPEPNPQGSYLIKLRVTAGKGKVKQGLPYQFRVGLSGIFSFLPEATDDEKSQFLYYNAPAMLYGIARGMVGEVTATGRQKRYILPSVNFQKVFQARQRRRARQKPKQGASVPAEE